MTLTFQIFTAMNMKMTVIRDAAPCCLIKTERRFRDYFLHNTDHQTSETSVIFYQTTWRDIPWHSHFHSRRFENLKSRRDLHNDTLFILASISNVVNSFFLTYQLLRYFYRFKYY
jgi:hypothetical protein